MTRFIDTFLYNGEERMARARTRLLAGHDVRHVAIEGSRTFQGEPRQPAPLDVEVERYWVHLPDGGDDKFHHVGQGPHWGRERIQRDAVLDLLDDEPDDALVLICDADELIDPNRLREIARRAQRGPIHLAVRNFYYSQHWQGPPIWSPVAAYVGYLRHPDALSPFSLRTAGLGTIQNAGWHCSYWGGPEAIKAKLAAFSHTEVASGARRQQILEGVVTGTGPNGEKLTRSADFPGTVAKALDLT